ncbi:hypothetical protein HLB35_15860 [Halomonas sp. TBZ9]|uniref:Uncharacterized protein n=1 Tax=Vreelandella azerica TaxID=2732867 RepID=A0A7Y3TZC6_9GAMM|nr:hypothetical protein [Halomonas azerica]NOG32870.1 hypothetical protein [Halomonas azerica]
MKAPMATGATVTIGLHHGTDLETTAMHSKIITNALAGAYRYAQEVGPALLPALALGFALEVLA